MTNALILTSLDQGPQTPHLFPIRGNDIAVFPACGDDRFNTTQMIGVVSELAATNTTCPDCIRITRIPIR